MTSPTTEPPPDRAILAELRGIRELLAEARPEPAELLGRDEMAALLGCGLSTFDKLKAAGKVGPRPVELGGVKWHRPEVLAWLRSRTAAGELHDAPAWPAVWRQLQQRKG